MDEAHPKDAPRRQDHARPVLHKLPSGHGRANSLGQEGRRSLDRLGRLDLVAERRRRGATVKARRPHGIHPQLAAHLRRRKRLHGGTFIVEHARHRGEPCIDIGKSLETACKRVGGQRLTPHALKHAAITLYIQGGGSAEDAADYFSTSIATIQKTYWHHSPHHQARALASIGNLGRAPAQKLLNCRKTGTSCRAIGIRKQALTVRTMPSEGRGHRSESCRLRQPHIRRTLEPRLAGCRDCGRWPSMVCDRLSEPRKAACAAGEHPGGSLGLDLAPRTRPSRPSARLGHAVARLSVFPQTASVMRHPNALQERLRGLVLGHLVGQPQEILL